MFRALVVVLFLTGISRAQPAPEPWQVGVSDADKATAQTQLELGNNLFSENRYEEALAAYRTGLAAWKHPSIQFNIAATLISLGRFVEALDELEQAMRFGPKPLKDQWREALSYQMLLAEKVGTLAVRCDAAFEVTLDTSTPIKCPGQVTLRVRSGEHVLLSQRPGFLTQRKKLVVAGGKVTSETISLVALKDAAITRTRWATWKPWLVVGAGAAVAAGGLLLDLQAQSLYGDYERALIENCGDLACSAGELPALDRARSRERIGIGLMVAGGLGVATGVALVILNRPFTEIPSERRLAVAPVALRDGFGLALAGRWR